MPYPTVSGPYGLIPINLIGGQVFASATRQIPIPSAYTTAIYFGDVVKLATNGQLAIETNTATATPVGVFLGCAYTDPTYGKTFRQAYPGAVTASDIVGYVQDDPDALFKTAVVSSGTTIGSVTRANVGENTALVLNTGNTITGNSQVAISATCTTTSTLPIRIIDVIAETANTATSTVLYTEVVIKWNQGLHQYLNPTGV
jgi:Tfp pilus assembly protein PilW